MIKGIIDRGYWSVSRLFNPPSSCLSIFEESATPPLLLFEDKTRRRIRPDRVLTRNTAAPLLDYPSFGQVPVSWRGGGGESKADKTLGNYLNGLHSIDHSFVELQPSARFNHATSPRPRITLLEKRPIFLLLNGRSILQFCCIPPRRRIKL